MSPIQLILVPLLLLIAVLYFAHFRSGLLDRIIVLALGTAGTVMIMVPEWANSLANLVGVGRGADLVNYLGWVGITFVLFLLYSKLRVLESNLTELARGQAIEHARAPTAEKEFGNSEVAAGAGKANRGKG